MRGAGVELLNTRPTARLGTTAIVSATTSRWATAGGWFRESRNRSFVRDFRACRRGGRLLGVGCLELQVQNVHLPAARFGLRK